MRLDVDEVPETIRIHIFEDAPTDLQDLSFNGGDEDYIAEVPPNFTMIPSFLDEGSPFGCSSVEKHHHPYKKGWIVLIGCHA
jgi:hypothetical protein